MLGSLLSDPTVSSPRHETLRASPWLASLFLIALGLGACSEDATPGMGTVTNPSGADEDEDKNEEDKAEPPASTSKDAGPKTPLDASRPVTRDSGSGTVSPGVGDGGTSSSGPSVGIDAGVVPLAEAGVATPATPLAKCKGGALEACGTFVSRDGKEIPLGPLGAVMEPNVGKGFENAINSSDNATSCALFSSLFGQDPEASAELNDIKDLDLKLYTVYRPANWEEGKKYPLVSWGNGTCAQPEGYAALLRYVASHGFVVVAPNSRYVGSGAAQKRAIDFMLKANTDSASPYFGKIDDSKIAAMGHSQGGQGTVAASSDARIKTVILFNGGTSASKPFLGLSGDRDIGSPTASTYATAIGRADKAAYLFYHKIPGTGNSDGHLTLMLQPERVTEPTTHWLRFLLNDDAESKEWFVGASCKLCGNPEDYEFGQKGL